MTDQKGGFVQREERIDYVVSIDVEGEDRFFTGFAGQVRNISRGGLFIATQSHPPIGTKLMVSFTVPGMARSVTANVEVRWVRAKAHGEMAAGVGVRFLDLPPEAEAAVNRFIRKHSGTEILHPDPDD